MLHHHAGAFYGRANANCSTELCFMSPKLTNAEQGVFTYLIEKLGVKDVQFSELITLEPEELRQLGDVYGVIFLFKYPTGETRSDTPKDGSYDHDAVNNMFFANQTIQNACGTQALLSVLLNKDKESGGEVDIGATLREFKGFTEGFPPDVCTQPLERLRHEADTHSYEARRCRTQISSATCTTRSRDHHRS